MKIIWTGFQFMFLNDLWIGIWSKIQDCLCNYITLMIQLTENGPEPQARFITHPLNPVFMQTLALGPKIILRHHVWACRMSALEGVIESFPIIFHVGKLCPGTQNLLVGLELECTLRFFCHTMLPELKPCPPTRITRHGEWSLTSGNFLQWVDRTPQWWTTVRWSGQNAGGCRRQLGLREFNSKGPGVWEG